MVGDLGGRDRYKFAGTLNGAEMGSDPPDPPEGQFVVWMSNGSGTGSDGDIYIKVTSGGTTRIGILSTTQRLKST